MTRNIIKYCEECSDESNSWRGGWKHGHFVCRKCIRHNKFPNLFKKLYGDVHPFAKQFKKRRRYRFKKEEELVLFHKHERDMSEEEYKEHLAKMKGIVNIVKSMARRNQPKPDFKDSFTLLTKRKVKE